MAERTTKQPRGRRGIVDERAARQGVVVSHLGVAVDVDMGSGERLRLRVPRRSGIVVGDDVLVEGPRVSVAPRRTQLLRRSPGGGVHVVAANLQALCVVAAVDPPARAGLVDRAAVAARAAGVAPALVVNKADLADPHDVVQTMTARAEGEMPVFVVSAHDGTGMAALAAFIRAQGRAALVGPSGVGKSSLLNRLVPDAQLATRALSSATGAGRHTTSASTLLALPGGGELVDTPGVREFGLVDVPPHDLALYFPGFARVTDGCRFRDCLHEDEPACAVKRAVDMGVVPAERYAAYRALLTETKTNARG